MKQKTLGILLMIGGAVVFILYWFILLEKLQVKYIELKDKPSWAGSVLLGAIIGVLFASLMYVGKSLTGDVVVPSSKPLRQLIKSKAWLQWIILSAILFIAFTLMWRGDL